jgi:hypothetical protein
MSIVSYSERKIFALKEVRLWREAERLVSKVPKALADTRCHELARAVGHHLHLTHQDGFYGFVDHTWLWTKPLSRTIGRLGFPHILDVYCVGSLPMVRLVDGESPMLPHVGWAYRPGEERTDIDEERVRALIKAMKRA